MTALYDKTRVLFCKLENEDYPTAVGAIAESTWEIIPPEEWDKIKREWGEQWLGPDWVSYEFVEVVVTIPSALVADLFDARSIESTTIERGRE